MEQSTIRPISETTLKLVSAISLAGQKATVLLQSAYMNNQSNENYYQIKKYETRNHSPQSLLQMSFFRKKNEKNEQEIKILTSDLIEAIFNLLSKFIIFAKEKLYNYTKENPLKVLLGGIIGITAAFVYFKSDSSYLNKLSEFRLSNENIFNVGKIVLGGICTKEGLELLLKLVLVLSEIIFEYLETNKNPSSEKLSQINKVINPQIEKITDNLLEENIEEKETDSNNFKR